MISNLAIASTIVYLVTATAALSTPSQASSAAEKCYLIPAPYSSFPPAFTTPFFFPAQPNPSSQCIKPQSCPASLQEAMESREWKGKIEVFDASKWGVDCRRMCADWERVRELEGHVRYETVDSHVGGPREEPVVGTLEREVQVQESVAGTTRTGNPTAAGDRRKELLARMKVQWEQGTLRRRRTLAKQMGVKAEVRRMPRELDYLFRHRVDIADNLFSSYNASIPSPWSIYTRSRPDSASSVFRHLAKYAVA